MRSISTYTMNQLCNKLEIPTSYYKKIPHWLQSQCATHGFGNLPETDFLVRGKNDIVRALLSDSYVIYNNRQVADIVTSLLNKDDSVYIHRFHYSYRSMYVKVVSRELVADDGLRAGIVIGNSEVGSASVSVEPFVFRLACTNDLVVTDDRSKRLPHIWFTHQELTRRLAEGVSTAFVGAADSMDRFLKAKDEPIMDPLETIKRLARERKMTEEFAKKVETSYLSEPQSNKYEIINAFTGAARTLQDHETRMDIERFAGKLLNTSLN